MKVYTNLSASAASEPIISMTLASKPISIKQLNRNQESQLKIELTWKMFTHALKCPFLSSLICFGDEILLLFCISDTLVRDEYMKVLDDAADGRFPSAA